MYMCRDSIELILILYIENLLKCIRLCSSLFCIGRTMWMSPTAADKWWRLLVLNHNKSDKTRQRIKPLGALVCQNSSDIMAGIAFKMFLSFSILSGYWTNIKCKHGICKNSIFLLQKILCWWYEMIDEITCLPYVPFQRICSNSVVN